MGKKYSKKEWARILERARTNGYEVKNNDLVHRIVWKQHHGSIPKNWVVHHIDFNHANNHIDNLIALPSRMHRRIHEEMEAGGFRYSKQQIENMLAGARTQQARAEMETEEAASEIAELEAEIEGLQNKIKDIQRRIRLKRADVAAVYKLYGIA